MWIAGQGYRSCSQVRIRCGWSWIAHDPSPRSGIRHVSVLFGQIPANDNHFWIDLPIFQELLFGAGSCFDGHRRRETRSGSRSPPRIAWLCIPVSPAWMISIFLSRWKLQLFSSGFQRWDPLSSEPSAVSIVLPSLASLARGQPGPREFPAPPQRAPLLQDLPHELLETTGTPLSEPRKAGSHQPTPFTPLHGGRAQTVFPEKRQS